MKERQGFVQKNTGHRETDSEYTPHKNTLSAKGPKKEAQPNLSSNHQF